MDKPIRESYSAKELLREIADLINFADQDGRSLQGDNMLEFRKEWEPLIKKKLKRNKLKMDISTQTVMFSSEDTTWATPANLFDKLNQIYNFTLDPCASHSNYKCEKYYTKEVDGLSKSWKNEIVFMNPPYGRHIKAWIVKAWEEAKQGATVVCLLPARTDTRWWHKYCMRASKIYFIKGRVKFGSSTNSAPFPSAVVVFNPLSQYEIPTLLTAIGAKN